MILQQNNFMTLKLKLKFFLFLMCTVGNSNISFGGGEKATEQEIHQIFSKNEWDDENIGQAINILSNKDLSGVNSLLVIRILNRVKQKALGLDNVGHFFKTFLPKHVVLLFDKHLSEMSEFFQGSAFNSIEYFGNLQNIEKIIKIFLRNAQTNFEPLVKFVDGFKQNQNFSSIIELLVQNLSGFQLKHSDDIYKVASWLEFTKEQDLKFLLARLLWGNDYDHSGWNGIDKIFKFSQINETTQKKICLKTQQLTDSDFCDIWTQFIQRRNLCLPSALYQLDIKKIERSGLLLTVLTLPNTPSSHHMHKKMQEMRAAIAGKIFPYFKEKKIRKNEEQFIQMLIGTEKFLKSLEKIEVFSNNVLYGLLALAKKAPNLMNTSQFSKYFDEWVNKNLQKEWNECSFFYNSTFFECFDRWIDRNISNEHILFDPKKMPNSFDLKKYENFLLAAQNNQNFKQSVIVNFANAFVSNIEGIYSKTSDDNYCYYYHALLSHLSCVETKNLPIILKGLLSKELEPHFLNLSKENQKYIFSRVNELSDEDFNVISHRIFHIIYHVNEFLSSGLTKRPSVTKETQQIEKI
ncbi:hypothetical protein P618_200642 [Holospora obtusa F1]|uniref:Uncharacterized protein n=1 Tax=Holospora obtusa F1 TaxID=1399147 RepID=W6TE30_HOLOB|nr:hypothetical protein [Holospora obtusa]ETZ07161.1 hypothetical protein P618_200642 [Holospora obtusa F1]